MRLHALMLGAVAAAGLGGLTERAGAQWWWPPTEGLGVSPSCIDPSTPIELRLAGQWPDHCVPNGSMVVVDGNEIHIITMREPPPQLCFTVITNWSLAQSAGPLPVGRYTVLASYQTGGMTVHPRVPVGTVEVVASCGGACYANCDESTTAPVLNVNDFICFQSAFAAGCP